MPHIGTPGDTASAIPAFIGIGAARSGTTWLAKTLGTSPEIWIPPRKEIHYFTHHVDYDSPSFLTNEGVLKPLFGREKRHSQFRNKLMRAMGNNLLCMSPAQFTWDAKYFFGKRNDDWYRSLFQGRPEPFTGEITPAYSLLRDDDVARISRTFPHTKIIFIVRNPVDREWSTLLYHQKRSSKAITTLPRDKIVEYLSHPGLTARSDYPGIVRRWQRCFGEKRFLLVFYDEIVAAPTQALDRVARFLALTDREKLIENASYDTVNGSRFEPIPAWLKVWMSERHLRSLEQFAEMAGGPANDWLDRARAAIGRTREDSEQEVS